LTGDLFIADRFPNDPRSRMADVFARFAYGRMCASQMHVELLSYCAALDEMSAKCCFAFGALEVAREFAVRALLRNEMRIAAVCHALKGTWLNVLALFPKRVTGHNEQRAFSRRIFKLHHNLNLD
jgi:hypothetical protein